MASLFPPAIRRALCVLAIGAVSLPTAASAVGEIVSSTRIAGAPDGATAYRIHYRSTDKDGRPIVVSGAMVVPAGPAPAGGRPVVVWAHGASGIAENCGLSDKPGLFGQIAGLNSLLAAGYVVAAPDYQGLGNTGPHPFLVGTASAHTVLDSVRAARALPGAKASSRYALWGESLGGFSVLWAGKLAARYAPELTLVGVAAAAPPTDLKANLTGGTNAAVRAFLTSYAAESWSRVYDVPLTTAVKPATAKLITAIARNCVSLDGFALRTKIGMLRLARQLRNVNLAESPRSGALMQQNSVTPTGFTMPLLVVQGSADVIVAPAVTRALVDKLCARRANVRFISIEGGDHVSVAKRSAPETVNWLGDRFAGKPAASSC
ncbi:alpha/beta fold hydrolase [Sphingomonas paeninsulae]|uniref:Alpha/beta fold hydrolase n=1 Tax=Sphingomonas paeninsulae TaxID=2319844 RepID=A0A494TAK0_SPHPE|nr:alpha/beta fold hydrolase [Sphingomonas paeninsulae]AYJ86357.1 alpha/beta fold hydrolase [Sphingomonas paeninsulae]